MILSSGPLRSPIPTPTKLKLASDRITVLCTIRLRTMIRLSAQKEIQLIELKSDYDSSLLQAGHWQDGILYSRRLKDSHEEGIKGIRVMPDLKGFMTWSGGGLLRIWNSDADCLSQFRVPLNDRGKEDFPLIDAAYEEGVKNQLTAVASVSNGKVLIAGDRFGLVRLINPETEKIIQLFYAHGSEIVDIAYCKSGDSSSEREVFITSSRDRTVQIFSLTGDGETKSWGLLQTLATHKSSVIKVLITSDGEKIVSCSSDRTMVVHQAVFSNNSKGESQIAAYAPEKVISLRSTPTDMFLDEDSETLVASCADKYIYVYKFPTGELVSSFKSVDRKGDSLVLHDISIIRVPSLTPSATPRKKQKQAYLVGIGNDKSIRVYEHPSGVHVGCEWGHSEGVSGLELIKNTASTDGDGAGGPEWVLASSGIDGCVFLWSLKGLDSEQNNWGNHRLLGVSDSTISASARTSPARKILTKAELARLMKVPESRSTATPSPPRTVVSQRSKTLPIPITPSPTVGTPPGARPLSVVKTRSLRHSLSTLSLSSSQQNLTPTDPSKRMAHRRSGSLTTTPITTPLSTPSNITPSRSVDRLKSTPVSNMNMSPVSSTQTHVKEKHVSVSQSDSKTVHEDYSSPKSEEARKPYGMLRRQKSSRSSMLATIPSASIGKVEKPTTGNIFTSPKHDAKLALMKQKKAAASSSPSATKSFSRRISSTLHVKVAKPNGESNTMGYDSGRSGSSTVSPTSLFSAKSSSLSPVTPPGAEPAVSASSSSAVSAIHSSDIHDTRNLTSINALSNGLSQFRDKYRQNKKSGALQGKNGREQEAMERLKREMKQTLVLLEGTLRERAKVDELVELFGDRLVEMISSKLPS